MDIYLLTIQAEVHMLNLYMRKNFPCDSCGYLFTNNLSLSTHIKPVHEDKRFLVTHVIIYSLTIQA